MTLQQISLGAAANDGTGDDARTAGGKINAVIARLNDVINVKNPAFNAVGDGVTDDTAAITAAIAAAIADGIKVIRFPKGVYVVDDLTVSASNLTFLGDDHHSCVLKAKNGSEGYIFFLTGKTDITFRQLGFDGNKANQAAIGSAIRAEGASHDLTIEFCRFVDCEQSHISLSGTGENANIRNNQFEGAGGHAVSVTNFTSGHFTGNRVSDSGDSDLVIDGGDNWNVTLNQFKDAGATNVIIINADGVNVANNKGDGSGAHGLQFNTCTNGKSANNDFRNTTLSAFDWHISTGQSANDYADDTGGDAMEIDSGADVQAVNFRHGANIGDDGISVYESKAQLIGCDADIHVWHEGSPGSCDGTKIIGGGASRALVIDAGSATDIRLLGWEGSVTDTGGCIVQSYGSTSIKDALNVSQTFKNRLFNGTFQINQRLASSNADDTYCFDRWYVLTQSGAVACSQLTDPETGAPYGIRITQSQASAQRIGLAQIIESRNCRDLRSLITTLAGRVRLSTSADVRYAVLEWTGTADSVTSDVVNDWTSTDYTAGNFFNSTTLNVLAVGEVACTATTWRALSGLNATVGASANNIIVMVWTEGTLAQNETLDLNRMQYEVGSIATVFEAVSIDEEIERCMRYYEKSFQLATAPAQNTGALAGPAHGTALGASTALVFNVPYLVRKRAAIGGSVTTYNPSAANAEARNVTGGADCGATAVGQISERGFRVNTNTDGAAAAGHWVAFHWTVDAEL